MHFARKVNFMSEIVFILGAGASKEAGAPLMLDFLDTAEELLNNDKVGNYKKDFEIVINAISNLQAVHSKSSLNTINIESVLAAFEMGRLINRLPNMDGMEIENLILSTRKLLIKTLEQTIKYPVRGEGHIYPNSSYNSFVELISNLNKNKIRCSIMTFNYDIALDFALNFHGIPVDYCLTEASKSNAIPYLKLHGSVNWGQCQM